MKHPKSTSSTRTTKTKSVFEFTGREILDALRATHQLPELPQTNRTERIDETTTITVRVPGGGDWSNMNLDLMTDAKVSVVIEQTESS